VSTRKRPHASAFKDEEEEEDQEEQAYQQQMGEIFDQLVHTRDWFNVKKPLVVEEEEEERTPIEFVPPPRPPVATYPQPPGFGLSQPTPETQAPPAESIPLLEAGSEVKYPLPAWVDETVAVAPVAPKWTIYDRTVDFRQSRYDLLVGVCSMPYVLAELTRDYISPEIETLRQWAVDQYTMAYLQGASDSNLSAQPFQFLLRYGLGNPDNSFRDYFVGDPDQILFDDAWLFGKLPLLKTVSGETVPLLPTNHYNKTNGFHQNEYAAVDIRLKSGCVFEITRYIKNVYSREQTIREKWYRMSHRDNTGQHDYWPSDSIFIGAQMEQWHSTVIDTDDPKLYSFLMNVFNVLEFLLDACHEARELQTAQNQTTADSLSLVL